MRAEGKRMVGALMLAPWAMKGILAQHAPLFAVAVAAPVLFLMTFCYILVAIFLIGSEAKE